MFITKTCESLNLIEFEELMTSQKIEVEKKDFAKAVKELYNWQKNPSADNFYSILYLLICKADIQNSIRILIGFPEAMIAYTLWCQSESSEKFFEEWQCLEGTR